VSFSRSSGLLLHPTSLPSRFGIGDLGDGAYAFVDFLISSGQSLWQVLPLGPTGYADSPYQCFSAFAGNPLLISPERLVADGLLSVEDTEEVPEFPTDRVDFGRVIAYKRSLLEKAFSNFQSANSDLCSPFVKFCRESEAWLDDYALFRALKDAYGGAAWRDWAAELARREKAALDAARGRFCRNAPIPS